MSIKKVPTKSGRRSEKGSRGFDGRAIAEQAPESAVPEHLQENGKMVLTYHTDWMTINPEGTLGELREWIEEAVVQCEEIAEWEGDPHIDDYEDIPEPLIYELDQWDNSEPDCTFSYRLANLEELRMNLEELEEELGPDFLSSAFRSTEDQTA